MNTMMRTLAIGALLMAPVVNAAGLEKSVLGVDATCGCKGPGDCTCPKDKCKCKNCGHAKKARVFDSLQGASETTRLPDTARLDARGGVFI